MRFKEALEAIIRSECAERTGDAFYLYSRLSDSCTSFADREKVRVFYELEKRLHIVRRMQTEGEAAVPALLAAYSTVAEVISSESYERLVRCVASVFFPWLTVQVTPKQPVRKAVVQRAVVERAPAPQAAGEAASTRTPLTTSSSYGSGGVWQTVLIIAGAALAVIAGIVCLIVFRKRISWTAWQFIIGIGGGLALAGVSFFVIMLLSDEFLWEAYHSTPLILLIIAIVNIVLLCVFRANYKIIFIFLSAFSVIGAGVSSFLAFDDIEEGWGIVQIVEGVLLVAALVLGLIFL